MEPTNLLERRRFLQAGAAAAGAVAAVGVAGASAVSAAQPAQDNGPDPFGGFTVGVQSYTFRNFRKLEDVLSRIQELGLHFVEFYNGHIPLDSSEADINAARALCFRHGVTPIAFGVEGFTKDHQANRRKFEFARKLGVRYLSADPHPDSFDSLDRLVAEFGIGIAIHPHGPAGKQMLHRWYSAEVILKAVESRHRLIGTCLDTGHLIRCAQDPFNRKLDPALQVRHMAARNFGLHLKDHDNAKRTDVVFGRGVLNVGEVLRALKDARFQGYISIEYEANPQNPSPDVRACLDVFKEAVRKLR